MLSQHLQSLQKQNKKKRKNFLCKVIASLFLFFICYSFWNDYIFMCRVQRLNVKKKNGAQFDFRICLKRNTGLCHLLPLNTRGFSLCKWWTGLNLSFSVIARTDACIIFEFEVLRSQSFRSVIDGGREGDKRRGSVRFALFSFLLDSGGSLDWSTKTSHSWPTWPVSNIVTRPLQPIQSLRWLSCFTSTETVGLLGTGAQDGHFDFHTAPEFWEVGR